MHNQPEAPLVTFLSESHAKHAPSAEYLHGHRVPFFENPTRIDHLLQHLQAANLIKLVPLPAPLPRQLIEATHDPELVTYLESLSANVTEIIQQDFAIYHLESELSGDEYYYESVFPPKSSYIGWRATARRFFTYDSVSPIGRGTWEAVLSSATAAYAGAQAIVEGERMAYALCRPPGHHAGRDYIGGYCYLNNAAIAANHLKAQGKVVILDIDYHHGNGTQDIFWDDPDVLFVSLHADPQVDYPYYSGFADETGGEGAQHTTVNIPLPHGTGAGAYLNALDKALAAIVAFSPASMVISLGFDTFHDDPMGHFMLDTTSFSELGRRITRLKLPTLFVQEGGYAIEALGELAVSFFRGVAQG